MASVDVARLALLFIFVALIVLIARLRDGPYSVVEATVYIGALLMLWAVASVAAGYLCRSASMNAPGAPHGESRGL